MAPLHRERTEELWSRASASQVADWLAPGTNTCYRFEREAGVSTAESSILAGRVDIHTASFLLLQQPRLCFTPLPHPSVQTQLLNPNVKSSTDPKAQNR